MRRLSTIVLLAAAALAVTVSTGGSAYAGEATTTTWVSTPYLVTQVSGDFNDDLTTGCRSHREDAKDSTAQPAVAP
jgi:hypothetical protein